MHMSVLAPEMAPHRPGPGLELWQPNCSPRHQEYLVSDYCVCGHGLTLMPFLHRSLEEEGFNRFPL